MTEYITQEKAWGLAINKCEKLYDNKLHITTKQIGAICNAAIQHYKDSQPKTATTVREQESYRQGVADGKALTEAITQQAEALAQALAEVERLKLTTCACRSDGGVNTEQCEVHAAWKDTLHEQGDYRRERDQLRAQLSALQFDGELPPLPDFQFANENGALYGRVSMEYYARQAIANDRLKRGELDTFPHEYTHKAYTMTLATTPRSPHESQ
jgi:hypothetical protein